MKGAIEPVPDPFVSNGFFSPYFLIQKKGGGLHPLLDLQLLNTFIRNCKCRMVTLALIILSLPQGALFAAIDMKDAHFRIDIRPAHRRLLHFSVGDNHYQFRVLPFGTAMAPRVFTKVVPVVVAQLRLQEYSVFPYLDDWATGDISPHQNCRPSMLSACSLPLLASMNEEKSVLVLT